MSNEISPELASGEMEAKPPLAARRGGLFDHRQLRRQHGLAGEHRRDEPERVDAALEAPGRVDEGDPHATLPAASRRSGSIMVDNIQDCEPGMYWMYYLEDGEVILAC